MPSDAPAPAPTRAARSTTAAASGPLGATAAAGRTLDHPDRAAIRLEAVLHALSDPARLRIVRALAELPEGEGLACSALDLGIAKSTTTHHFRVLREAGVIHQGYRGTAKLSALRRADLAALFPGLMDSVLNAADGERTRCAGR